MLGEAIREGVPEPEELERGLLIRGAAHQIFTGAGEGKTWVALWLMKQAILREQRVMFFDAENGKRIITERLQLLNVGPEVDDYLYYCAFPSIGVGEKDSQLYRDALDTVAPELVVFDSWVGFLAGSGLDENSNSDVEAWANAYIGPAKARGCTVLILDHVGHADKSRSRAASRKKDVVDVQWQLNKTSDFSRDKVGYIQLKLHKDRESWLPKFAGLSIGGTEDGFVCERSEGTVTNVPDKLPESASAALKALEAFGEAGVSYTEWRDAIVWKGGTLGDSTFRTIALPKLKEASLVAQKGDFYYSTAQHFNSTAS